MMLKKAVVLSEEGEEISVLPISKTECASCSASCGKKQEALTVSNPKNFPLKAGEIVFIETSRGGQVFEALLTLLFPFCSAIAGYFAAAPLASHFEGRSSDGIRAVFVLSFLLISSILVFISTRLLPPKGKTEIVSISGKTSFTAPEAAKGIKQ